MDSVNKKEILENEELENEELEVEEYEDILEAEDSELLEDNEYIPKKSLRRLVMLVSLTAIMLVTSTYAWFSMQTEVTIGNLEGIVNVVEGLEISLDAENWSDTIDFSEYTDQNLLKQIYGETEHNIIPTELLPVSTTGKDGIGQTDITMYRGINTGSIKLQTVEATSASVTDVADNQYPGYYAIDLFIKNSSETEDGATEDILQINSNSLVSIKAGGSDATGLQNTVRVALALYEPTEEVPTTATQEEILSATTGTATIKDVAIWEPNSSDHVAQIVANNNRITWNPLDRAGYIADQVTGKFTATEKVPTYALKSEATAITGANEIEDIYNWSGANNLYLEQQVTLQTTKTADYYIAEGIQNLISVNSTPASIYPNAPTGEVITFKIPRNQVSRLRLYVWLEGQDVDCTNLASHGGGIEVNLGLVKNEKVTEFVSPSELFDKEGTNLDGLHIGDFINYDAGTWTQEEIAGIQTGLKTNLVTANGSTSRPSTTFQFGGFTAGSSRNENATPSFLDYNYVKDASTGGAITGWRVFDIEGDRVTLISAGNPEDYRHSYGTNYAYMSEYILTGNINSSWSDGATQAENYQRRDWSNYINTAQKGESATVLTKSRLDEWYTKYTDTPNANTWTTSTFQKIYNNSAYYKYQNMIDNYSCYWLSAAYNSYGFYLVYPHDRSVNSNYGYAFGVRVLVSLTSEVKLKKTGTKTVTGGWTTTYGGDQTYNVWDIK